MLLHHLSTFFLILSMLMANQIGIGCVICFLHNIADVPLCGVKFYQAIEGGSKATLRWFAAMLATWFYTRNLVLTYLTYRIWHLTYGPEYIEYQLVISGSAVFLSFLVILQWYWMWLFMMHILEHRKSGAVDDMQNND